MNQVFNHFINEELYVHYNNSNTNKAYSQSIYNTHIISKNIGYVL